MLGNVDTERPAARSDEEVMAALAFGQSEALAELYDRYGRLAHWLAYQCLRNNPVAEDVVQDVFVAIWPNAAHFDPDRGTVRAWLLASVRHRCIDLQRSRPGPVPLELDADQGALEPVDDVWERVVPKIDAEEVRRVIVTLPIDQRTTVYLAYYLGLTHSQIAARLQIPLGTVKSRLRLAFDKLRVSLVALEPLPAGA
jgi:RNA polymerase sigma-70 factor (ECF subfamily)